VSWNGYSLVAIFVENIGSFSKLKIIGLDQDLLKHISKTKQGASGLPMHLFNEFLLGIL